MVVVQADVRVILRVHACKQLAHCVHGAVRLARMVALQPMLKHLVHDGSFPGHHAWWRHDNEIARHRQIRCRTRSIQTFLFK